MSCDIYPPDPTTEVGLVRYYSGDSEIDGNGNYIVPDQLIEQILAKYTDKSASLRLYYTTLEVMGLMCAKLAPTAARSRQRELNVEVEIYGKERYDAVCSRLKELKRNPEDLFPDLYPEDGLIKVGGVRKSEMKRVRDNPDSNGSPCRITATPSITKCSSSVNDARLEDC